jgi:S-adenosylmethionine:tRNA ribosyltransferase-isomerase
MIAATEPVQRPIDAKLLVIDPCHEPRHATRVDLLDFLHAGDVVIANDAATLPASLAGHHVPTGGVVEVRLASRGSLSPDDVETFTAVVFGAGDFRTQTEQRPAPPSLVPGDRLALGPLRATITGVLDHPRLVSLRFEGRPDEIWSGLARHGRPLQYAHIATPLALWDVWTPIAGSPVAFEPPSAGFAIDWRTVAAMRDRRIEFATITLAAGISSTGDPELDARLPFDEPYHVPDTTADAINRTRLRHGRGRAASARQAGASGRIVAIGTTVVRALEHAADESGRVRGGDGIATRRIDRTTRLRAVDAILSGVHEPATSHYQLLRAFADDETLQKADALMNTLGYRTHEFGDSVLIAKVRLHADATCETTCC